MARILKNLEELKTVTNGNIKSVFMFLRVPENAEMLVEGTQGIDFDQKEASIAERYYCWSNGIKEVPKCPHCGKPRKFLKGEYRPTCGSKDCHYKSVGLYSNIGRDFSKINEKRKKTIAEGSGKEQKRFSSIDELIEASNGNFGTLQNYLRTEHNAKVALEGTSHITIPDGYEASINERVWLYMNGYDEVPLCPYCGRPRSFDGGVIGYRATCGDRTCYAEEQKATKSKMFVKVELTLDDYIRETREGTRSARSLIGVIKNNQEFTDEVKFKTAFLDKYEITDFVERIYYVLNDIDEVVTCKYCNNKATWIEGGGLGEFGGYRDTCSSDSCLSMMRSELSTGKTVISENREKEFIEWERNCTEINDEIVKEHIKYDKQLALIKNPIIIDYLDNRFEDSESAEETLKRIELGIEEKPLCALPGCTNHVHFIGRERGMFTKFCCPAHSAQSEETRKKCKETNLEHWGTENVYDSEAYRQKMMEEYGVEYVFQREDVKEKRVNTLLERYGVVSPLQSEEVRQKVYETMVENSTMQKSKAEDEFVDLIENAGYKVVRHYKTKEYPYNCDIYIPDYDLYIEYNGSQFHNTYSYMGTQEDKELINHYLKESERIKENEHRSDTQYDAMIYTWSNLDVRKRNHAQDNHLNFLEIYNKRGHLNNALFQLKFLIHCIKKLPVIKCPDNILKDEYNYFLNAKATELVAGVGQRNFIIKHFQCTEFFKKEMEIFATMPVVRRRLIQNRCKQLNKNEWQLTPNDILTGFKKSGIYYGYSHFNPLWTNWFVRRYKVKSVYDPCGGWGHHMLGMLSCSRIIYNDMNAPVAKNVRRMKDFFNISQLDVHNGDARTYVPEDVDAFFMCPPYYNVERYADESDFESMDEYKEFLNIIFEIWRKNAAKVFGVVLRDDFVGLIDANYSEKFEMNYNESHFARKAPKKHKEYFYIFKK